MKNAELRIIKPINQIDNYEVELVENDLIQLLEEIVTEYKIKADIKGLQLKFIKNLNNAKTECDRSSMYEILTNIIDNAIKFTNEGSVKIFIYKSIMNKITIMIKDTGIGISEHFMSNLLIPTPPKSLNYSELFAEDCHGLECVKTLANLNNIEILTNSSPGEGSTFSLTFK